MLGRQGLEEGEPGGRRQREMGTRRQVIETRMRWAADLIDRIMGEPIEWAPDLPLKGGTYECEYYRKD